jgi:hypothetical protein
MRLLSQLIMPILSLVAISCAMGAGWLLWTNATNKKAVKGKVKAYILMGNHQVWKGLCDYRSGAILAPWAKGSEATKKGDRIQVFRVEPNSNCVFYDHWPEAGFFQQTVPAVFLEENTVTPIFPLQECHCCEECEAQFAPGLSPDRLGQLEMEHITEATIKATAFTKDLFDRLSELTARLPPAWMTMVGFAVLTLAMVIMGILVWIRTSDIAWVKAYLGG